MSRFVIPLENVSVATPCHAEWNSMKGDERARFCRSCEKNVYNLSNMTRREAEALITAKEGRLCVRFYRREDGTILTQDCPVGLARVRRAVMAPLKWLAAGAALVIMGGAWLAGQEAFAGETQKSVTSNSGNSWRDMQPFKLISDWSSPAPTATPSPSEVEVTGAINIASSTSPAPPPPVPVVTPAPIMSSGEPESFSNAVIDSVVQPEVAVVPSPSPLPIQ